MKKLFFILVLVISIGINIYFLSKSQSNNEVIKNDEVFRQNLIKYPYLSPRILRDVKLDFIFNFLTLRSKLHQELDPLKDRFALYFEYLPTGTSIGINSTNEFIAASLFKLPVVMAYFRYKERVNPQNEIKVKLTKEMIDDRFGILWQKGVGYEIGLDEAAKIALTQSDNTAAEALAPVITQEDFDNVYEGLDIDLNITNKGAVMTAKNYSSILKALYFSAVLTKEDSQKILSYLTQSSFDDKLVAGIPGNIPVAHKIGIIDEESYKDCGIVYVPSRPYILCMVSVGTEEEARIRMSSISKIVYEYVANAKSPLPTKNK